MNPTTQLRTVLLPNIELNMESVTVTEVFIAPDDRIEVGQALGSVETQKANVEISSTEEGFVHEVFISVGQEIGEKAPICSAGDTRKTADNPTTTDFTNGPETVSSFDESTPAASSSPSGETARPPGKLRASPVARKVAKTLGIALADVTGTGPAGRITRRDVEEFAASASPRPVSNIVSSHNADDAWQSFPPQRSALIAQMEIAASTVPIFSLTRQIDVTPLTRKEPGITLTHRLIACLGCALGTHPSLLTSIEGGRFRIEYVAVAVAMDTASGLVAPAIRNPHSQTLGEIGALVQLLKARADAGQLKRADFERAPFALSNLGMYGVDQFQPSVFQGQCAVLGVGRAADAAAGRKTAWFTLTCDHRAVDGAEAARFLQSLQEEILAA